MEARLSEIEIKPGESFANCKLGRIKYAKILTKVVEQYTNGCVFAINGTWGCGKTTFIKMWKQSLLDNHFNTLYFNAWQDDFISDPIIGLLGQLKSLDPTNSEKNLFDNLCNQAVGIFNTISGGAVKNYTEGKELINGTISNDVTEYLNKREALQEFRKELGSYIDLINVNRQDGDNFKPLIFFIDELDRCCPSYAVKVLERIKHLFDIPNIVFILSIDKEQLSNSIRGYYGSDLIDANEYLKRFIDIEYNLPEPNVHEFCYYLYDTYKFSEFFNNQDRLRYFRRKNEPDEFLEMLEIVFKDLHYNLRQMEKACAHIRLILKTFGSNYYVAPGLLVLLMFFRDKEPDLYRKLYQKDISIEALVTYFETHFPRSAFQKQDNYSNQPRRLLYEIANFLVDYSKNNYGDTILPILNKDEEIPFTCNIMNKTDFTEAIKWYVNHKSGDLDVFDLNYLIDHIELLKGIQ